MPLSHVYVYINYSHVLVYICYSTCEMNCIMYVTTGTCQKQCTRYVCNCRQVSNIMQSICIIAVKCQVKCTVYVPARTSHNSLHYMYNCQHVSNKIYSISNCRHLPEQCYLYVSNCRQLSSIMHSICIFAGHMPNKIYTICSRSHRVMFNVHATTDTC